MVRSALNKVAWVGRTASMVFGLALVLALVMGVATMAFAANGANFVLGVTTNAATAMTKLTGNVSGKPALQVVNPNTGAGSHALQLITAAGRPPIVVNQSAGKAVNLNADKLDGQDSSEFYAAGSKVADADALGGKAPADYQPRVKWARVFLDGTFSGSRGVVSVTRENPGIYKVKFDEDVAHTCSIIGSLNSGSAPGFVKAGSGGTGTPNDTVLVTTQNRDFAYVDNHFYVTVLC